MLPQSVGRVQPAAKKALQYCIRVSPYEEPLLINHLNCMTAAVVVFFDVRSLASITFLEFHRSHLRLFPE